MLAKRMPTILPQLSAPESIETTPIYSAMGQLPTGQHCSRDVPFEVPAVPFEELSTSTSAGTNSTQMREDAIRARRKANGSEMARSDSTHS